MAQTFDGLHEMHTSIRVHMHKRHVDGSSSRMQARTHELSDDRCACQMRTRHAGHAGGCAGGGDGDGDGTGGGGASTGSGQSAFQLG